jgi:hypothetical protein
MIHVRMMRGSWTIAAKFGYQAFGWCRDSGSGKQVIHGDIVTQVSGYSSGILRPLRESRATTGERFSGCLRQDPVLDCHSSL